MSGLRNTLVSYEYRQTFEDYKAAQRLHLKHLRGARFRFYGWMIGLPFLSVMLLAMLLLTKPDTSSESFGLTMWLFVCSLFATISVVVLRPYNLRRCYRKMMKVSNIDPNHVLRFSFDEQGVTSAIPGRSEGRFYWTAILDFAEDSSIALLYIGRKRFLFIPKRTLDEAGWESLRHLLSTRSARA